ncbi:nucleotidyl transferase AbiEii/AbiGii toxin family protein [Micrococcus sp.]|uniref:nucleotidyl transferase AbiEii/AbiGii toxin family protein n=1 Tax=Micrococcus sp. TaxID=1271 RepID=UPI002A91BC6E|nr:nucleotidyl transferase AbiEii/AbiGii toxin family protein [Micrococcus sp.]MDY6055962.1 nucleotidyl transferase AbiEii/AbiGii toxin family protein [Micrococcus sp.]
MTSADPRMERLAELAQQAAPRTEAELNRRLASIAEALGVPERRARRLLGAAIVAQMLPSDTAVKGGIGVKIRVGETGTRATRDLDVTAHDRRRAVEALTAHLERGWGEVPASKSALKKDPNAGPRVAFFGSVAAQRQASPAGVPPQYVLQPYTVRLCFLTPKTTMTSVLLEIGVDEFDGAAISPPDLVLSEQVAAAVAALGCGAPGPVSIISIEQQVAQKIHAVTDPAENRGHDLVDIQVLWQEAAERPGGVDLPLLADLCRRTFAYRSTSRTLARRPPHTWPPGIEHVLTLSSQYESALDEVKAGLDEAPPGIAPDVELAGQWLQGVMGLIEAAMPNGVSTPPTTS